MAIKRRGSASWQGGIKDGKGAISTESGALKSHPERLETTAEVTLDRVDGAYTITAVHLTLKGRVPGADRIGLSAR